MKGTALRLVGIAAATVVILPILLCEDMLHAQIMSPPTIDSRDTRTMEDTRGQDPRQNPGPVPPSAIELMKRLNEGKAPDGAEESNSSRDHKNQGNDATTKDMRPNIPPSADK